MHCTNYLGKGTRAQVRADVIYTRSWQQKVGANCWAAQSRRAITLRGGGAERHEPQQEPQPLLSLSIAFLHTSSSSPAPLHGFSIYTYLGYLLLCLGGHCSPSQGWVLGGLTHEESQHHAGGYQIHWELCTGQKTVFFGINFPLLVRAWEVLVAITGHGHGHHFKPSPWLRAGWVQGKGWSWLGQGWGWTSSKEGPKDVPPGGKLLRNYNRSMREGSKLLRSE